MVLNIKIAVHLNVVTNLRIVWLEKHFGDKKSTWNPLSFYSLKWTLETSGSAADPFCVFFRLESLSLSSSSLSSRSSSKSSSSSSSSSSLSLSFFPGSLPFSVCSPSSSGSSLSRWEFMLHRERKSKWGSERCYHVTCALTRERGKI